MQVVFLYGPPAVGKLTVAKVLKKMTGFNIFHSHMLINPIAELFGYEHPARRKLVREIRLRILEEAAKNNVSLIVTVGNTGPQVFDYFDKIIQTVESHGGRVCLVQLTADTETLFDRLKEPSRKKQGKTVAPEKMQSIIHTNPHIFDTYKKKKHLTINNSKLSPEESVKKIMSYYHLQV